MGGTSGPDESWTLECSDDELVREGEAETEGQWAPRCADLHQMYDNISSLQLEWRCLGRRLPSPPRHNQADDGPLMQQSSLNSPSELSNFDFKDEMNSVKLRVRREGEDTLRGSAKKKTTSFDGIVSNIMRHKKIQQMERNRETDGTQ